MAKDPSGSMQISTNESGTVKLSSSADQVVHMANPSQMDCLDDLTSLSYLHEPGVLHTLKMRYGQEAIYTYSGIVLIAVNPFSRLPLYSPEISQLYSGKRRGELDPHLYATAEDAFREMSDFGRNQTIIVSGESGAGKTISAKYIMRYFANIDQLSSSYHHGGDFAASQVEQQVLATNPIMEAFGNAKTVRNDNSSRFGKYIQIYFDDDESSISGANMRTYLLERSRVAFQPENERNYHIFYQLCAGVANAEKKQLALSSLDNFHYLNQGGVHGIPGVDDAAEFQNTVKALSTVGISVAKQWDIFKLLAVILHIGNIKLSQADGDTASCFIDSNDVGVKYTCRLLGIDHEELLKWLTHKRIVTRSDVIVTEIGLVQGLSARDAFAKYLYHHLFYWLVVQINASLENAGMNGSPSSMILSSYMDSNNDGPQKEQRRFIAVLDIYGFEHFKRNSFEQFCINYANEKLQQEFNQHVFKLEQEEYVREKIQWSFIDFNDNKPCLELIEGKLGILSLLDEESRLPSGNDSQLVSKLYQSFYTKPNAHSSFEKPRFSNSAFTVCHYAHAVDYEIDGFIDKNKDTMPEEILSLLQKSSLEIVHELLGPSPAEDSNNRESSGKAVARKAKPTLGSSFKSSLKSLMDIINTTSVHYIRCIKPNEQKKPFHFDSEYVLQQLRACGVLETIRISCAGYPSRFMVKEFSDRFNILVPSQRRVKQVDEMCRVVLESVLSDSDKFQIGLTKVFLRAGQLAFLEKQRIARLNSAAIMLQKNVKCHQVRCRYINMKKVALATQTVFRGYLARRHYKNMQENRAALIIQRHCRGYLARREYSRTKEYLVNLQAQCRMFLVRRAYIKQLCEERITKFQLLCRVYLQQKKFIKYRQDVTRCQSSVRRWLAKRQLMRLKVEARSIQGVQQKAGALEKKVFELTQLLIVKEKSCDALQNRLSDTEGQLASAKSEIVALKLSHTVHKNESASTLFMLKETYEIAAAELKDAQLKTVALEKQLLFERGSHETTIAELKIGQENPTLSNSNAAMNEMEQKMQSLLIENQQLKSKLAKSIRGGKTHIKSDSITSLSVPESPITPAKILNASEKPSSSSEAREPVGRKSGAGHSSHRRHGSLDSAIRKVVAEGSGAAVSISRNAKSFNHIELLCSHELETELHFLITHVRIPKLDTSSQLKRDDAFLSVNIFGQIASQMWDSDNHERMKFVFDMFIIDVRSTIRWSDDESCAFWLGNLYHLICLLTASNQILQKRKHAHMQHDQNNFDRCRGHVEKFLVELEELTRDIYYRWLADLKRRLYIIGPAAILEHQDLPEYIDDPSSLSMNSIGFISKWMASAQTGTTVVQTMETLLTWLSQLENVLNCYFVEENVHRQLMVKLLRLLGTSSFNQLLMRKNFCSWRRGMQIQYNCTRIDEWCSNHNLSEASLHMEPLMQAAKLFQINKSDVEDLETIYDVCFLLSPLQIKKLLTIYRSDEYDDHSVSKTVMNMAILRCLNDQDFELMLETNDDVSLFIPLPVGVTSGNVSIPAELSNHLKIIPQLGFIVS